MKQNYSYNRLGLEQLISFTKDTALIRIFNSSVEKRYY